PNKSEGVFSHVKHNKTSRPSQTEGNRRIMSHPSAIPSHHPSQRLTLPHTHTPTHSTPSVLLRLSEKASLSLALGRGIEAAETTIVNLENQS
ncbi:MAG TPA: hypothetical protein VFJ58_22355, partial [Armatimonadota bacterium]|nr:hypothetical protein [Armatimonadota bacterium]